MDAISEAGNAVSPSMGIRRLPNMGMLESQDMFIARSTEVHERPGEEDKCTRFGSILPPKTPCVFQNHSQAFAVKEPYMKKWNQYVNHILEYKTYV